MFRIQTRRSIVVKHLGCAIAVLLAPAVAAAADPRFPAAERFLPLPCGEHAMFDPWRDESGAIGERDLVGDRLAAAGYSASDQVFLYLRLRVDGSPKKGTELAPYVWGVAVDTDDDPRTFELLLVADGRTSEVVVYRNTVQSTVDNPREPADSTKSLRYPFGTHADIREASGSRYGDDPDYFVTFAVPWADLRPLRLTPASAVHVWAGTSSDGNALNGDLACHDGRGGPARLSVIAPTRTVLDPFIDSDGDGYPDRIEVIVGVNPADKSSGPTGAVPDELLSSSQLQIQGGGGCSFGRPSTGHNGVGLSLWLLLGALGWLLRAGPSRRSVLR